VLQGGSAENRRAPANFGDVGLRSAAAGYVPSFL
jgi:hypothetical protein